MRTALLLGLNFITTSAIAGLSLEEKVANAYERQKTEARIFCQHPGVKEISSKLVKGSHIQTLFQIEDFSFTISVDKKGNTRFHSKSLNLTDSLDRRKNIKFNFDRTNSLVTKFKLNQLQCEIGVYYDKPIKVNTTNVHINVHPHQRYDKDGITIDTVERYLNDNHYTSIVLLDKEDFRHATRNNLRSFIEDGRSNFRTSDFGMPVVNIPQQTMIYSASSGISLYDIEVDNLNITYTGGNINYCMWNNTLSMIRGFMKNSTGGTLNLTYDMDALVAQKKNKYFGPTFRDNGKYNSINVQALFKRNTHLRNEFHKDYIENVSRYEIQYRQNFYKTLTFKYSATGTNYTKLFKGTGKGNYTIHMQYINE